MDDRLPRRRRVQERWAIGTSGVSVQASAESNSRRSGLAYLGVQRLVSPSVDHGSGSGERGRRRLVRMERWEVRRGGSLGG